MRRTKFPTQCKTAVVIDYEYARFKLHQKQRRERRKQIERKKREAIPKHYPGVAMCLVCRELLSEWELSFIRSLIKLKELPTSHHHELLYLLVGRCCVEAQKITVPDELQDFFAHYDPDPAA